MSAFSQSANVPKGWKEVTGCETSIIVPEDLEHHREYLRDNCGTTFEKKDILVRIYRCLCGVGSDSSEGLENYTFLKLKLIGYDATLITYFERKENRNVTIANIPIGPKMKELPIPSDGSIVVYIYTKPSIPQKIPKRIYESIRNIR